jgi:hypothetical protein
MAVVSKGSFSLDLHFVKLGADFTDEDRQCAWELYTELATRVAVTGKSNDPKCNNFDGELYVESLDSLYTFFREARAIMRQFPVGKIGPSTQNHLGIFIGRALFGVLRPFLEKWHVRYRHWWEYESNKALTPFERQKDFQERDKFLADWTNVRFIMRKMEKRLVDAYKLTELGR